MIMFMSLHTVHAVVYRKIILSNIIFILSEIYVYAEIFANSSKFHADNFFCAR